MAKNVVSKVILLVLNIIIILANLLSLYVYSSKWHMFGWRITSGEEFLIIPMVALPIFIIVGIIMYIFRNKLGACQFNILMPFASIVAFFLPILIDGSLSNLTISIGAILGIIVTIATIIVSIKNLIK